MNDPAHDDLIEFIRKRGAGISSLDVISDDGRRLIWNRNCGEQAVFYGNWRDLRTRRVVSIAAA